MGAPEQVEAPEATPSEQLGSDRQQLTPIQKALQAPEAAGWEKEQLAYRWWADSSLSWTAFKALVGPQFDLAEAVGAWQGYWQTYWVRKQMLGAEVPEDLPAWARPPVGESPYTDSFLAEGNLQEWQITWALLADDIQKAVASGLAGESLLATAVGFGVNPNGVSPLDDLQKALDSSALAAGGQRQRQQTTFAGLPVKIDRPKGFVQKGKDAEGVSWERTYTHDYGYIPRTLGGDGDQLDVFLGPNESAKSAYWVHQIKADGTFDEYKTLVGFDTAEQARAVYEAHVPKKFNGGMTEMPIGQMHALLGRAPNQYAMQIVKSLDQQIVTGPVLVPNQVDGQGDVATAAAIEQVAYDFLAAFNAGTALGVQHTMFPSTLRLLESWILKTDWNVGGRIFPAGTWMITVKVLDAALWLDIKEGRITGFSIAGAGHGRYLRKPTQQRMAA